MFFNSVFNIRSRSSIDCVIREFKKIDKIHMLHPSHEASGDTLRLNSFKKDLVIAEGYAKPHAASM